MDPPNLTEQKTCSAYSSSPIKMDGDKNAPAISLKMQKKGILLGLFRLNLKVSRKKQFKYVDTVRELNTS